MGRFFGKFIGFFTVASLLFIKQGDNLKNLVWEDELAFIAIGLALSLLGALMFYNVSKKESRAIYWVFVCCVVSFILRVLVINIFANPPLSDFKMYYEKAIQLITQDQIVDRYNALFPHILGYPLVLSFLFRVFGANYFVGLYFNAFLGACSILLIYKIASRFFSKSVGVIATFLYSFMPSIILYSSIMGTEELYNFLFLLTIYVFIRVSDVSRKSLVVIGFVSVGALLAYSNTIRPIGIVLLFAVSLAFLFWNNKQTWIIKGISILVMVMTFLLGNEMNYIFVESKCGYEPAKNNMYYGLMVGTNIESKGLWNEEDANLVSDENDTPTQSMNKALEVAKKRVFERPRDMLLMCFKKEIKLWCEDSYGAGWNLYSLEQHGKKETSQYNFLGEMNKICDRYYNYILIMVVITLVILSIKKSDSLHMVIPLIICGIAGSHFLVEVQNRYHFQSLGLFCILAAVGLVIVYQNIFTRPCNGLTIDKRVLW